MVVYGYLRVSTDKQCEQNYKHAILDFANSRQLGNVFFVSETVSGVVDWRKRELGKLFDKLEKGDIIILAEFSRISRDFFGALEFVSQCRKKGIFLYSINGDIPIKDDATSNLLLSVTSWKNQMERENLSMRTKIGLEARKKQGIRLGRPSTLKLEKNIDNVKNIKKDLENGCKKNIIAKRYSVSYPSLNNFIKKYNLENK